MGKITKNLLTTITGRTGSGKTFLAQTLFLQAVMTQIKSLYIDPKRSIRKQWLNKIKAPKFRAQHPELCAVIERINFLTLDYREPSNQGILDPIVFLPASDAKTVAFSMLSYLGGELKKEEKTALRQAIKQVVGRREKGDAVGFLQVIEQLQQGKEAWIRTLGDYYHEIVEDSVLSLAFSDGQTQGLSFDAHATVLEIADLTLPDEDSTILTEDEKYSVALMMALGTFCKQFGSLDDKKETVEFFDEVWVIMRSPEGRTIVQSMKRVGRSQNNKLVLITQSVNDVQDESDTTGAGERFCFYEDGEEEQILKTLKLGVNERHINWIRNMQSGQCVYKDVFGNIQRISIEALPAWVELFSPEEDSQQSTLEKRYQRS